MQLDRLVIIIRIGSITLYFLHLIFVMNTENEHNSNQYQDLNYQQEQNNDYYQISAPILNSHSSQYSQPPILSYSYSGISNASSTPQFTLHSSRMSEEPIYSFVFIKAQKLYLSLQRLVKDLRQAVALQDDIILYLLYRYQWSKDQIYEKYYLNADPYVIINQNLKENSKNFPEFKVATCSICQNQANLITNMLCHHRYCMQCWRQYINQQLNQNKIFFTCMNKCEHSVVLLHSFVEKVFPQLFELYRKIVCINYSVINKAISYCPSYRKQCDLFCERTENNCQICVECQCGQFYCFFCQKEPHHPATCQDVTKWMKLVNDEQSSTTWIQRNTKTCPSCKNPVQKYIGCSKIKCVCGAQFCYECNSKWDQTHKSSRGQCLSLLVRKSSLQERANTTDFMKLHQKVLAIERTCKKHLSMIDAVLEFIKEQWILTKFHGVRKEVLEAWQNLKWSSIISFIYKRSEGQSFFADQFIESIGRLMESVEKMRNIFNILSPKDIMGIGDEVQNRRDVLKKNKDIWYEAWRNNN